MDSFKIICTTLAQAEPDWWKYTDENTSPTNSDPAEVTKDLDDVHENNNDDDEGEIDLDAL